MKKIKLLGVIFSVIILTGCTDYKEINNENIIIEETGQRTVENILCRTDQTVEQFNDLNRIETEKIDNLLNNNEISIEEYNSIKSEIDEKFNIENIVMCNEFGVLSGDNGVWDTIFVKPLAWLILKLGELTTQYIFAIIIITLLIRLAMFPITKKTAMQSENMAAARSKLSKVEEKYRNKTDKDSQMIKAQETMKIYKDFNINPLSGCIYALIQIPLFMAWYEALNRLPVIFESEFLGINLGVTTSTAFSNGMWYYIIINILVIAATYFSFKLNKVASPVGDQANQMKIMRNISVIMISIASFTVSSGIAIYWITNSTFTIIQNLLVKREKKNGHII